MANYDVQVVIGHSSALPENQSVNTLHYDVNAPDTVNGLCDDIAAAYQSLQSNWSVDCSGLTVKVYEPGPNPSGPIYQESYPFEGGVAAAPAEVAICLSYAAVDDPEASTPRRRGRIYIGPLTANAMAARPGPSYRDAVLDLGELLANVGNLGNTTWKMLSSIDGSYHDIESIWCDDAWDTQRRRGLPPTLREVRNVQ